MGFNLAFKGLISIVDIMGLHIEWCGCWL